MRTTSTTAKLTTINRKQSRREKYRETTIRHLTKGIDL